MHGKIPSGRRAHRRLRPRASDLSPLGRAAGFHALGNTRATLTSPRSERVSCLPTGLGAVIGPSSGKRNDMPDPVRSTHTTAATICPRSRLNRARLSLRVQVHPSRDGLRKMRAPPCLAAYASSLALLRFRMVAFGMITAIEADPIRSRCVGALADRAHRSASETRDQLRRVKLARRPGRCAVRRARDVARQSAVACARRAAYC